MLAYEINSSFEHRSLFVVGVVVVLASCLITAGCSRPATEAPHEAPVAVPVSQRVEREITDYADFTARIAAVDSVDVRAHVWGYLQKVNFKEGALVKKGDVPFEIDPRSYQAALDQAKASLHVDEAKLKYDEAEYRRNLELIKTSAVSQSVLEQSAAARGVDLANIESDKAGIAARQLGLDYTKVTAPVSGHVSRYNVTVGNLVQSATSPAPRCSPPSCRWTRSTPTSIRGQAPAGEPVGDEANGKSKASGEGMPVLSAS